MFLSLVRASCTQSGWHFSLYLSLSLPYEMNSMAAVEMVVFLEGDTTNLNAVAMPLTY